jgi:hypothetical protein
MPRIWYVFNLISTYWIVSSVKECTFWLTLNNMRIMSQLIKKGFSDKSQKMKNEKTKTLNRKTKRNRKKILVWKQK